MLKFQLFNPCHRVESNAHVDVFIPIDLQKKLSAIEADNKTIREEFNVQRAKLKELFLQKEGDFLFCLRIIFVAISSPCAG